MSQFNDFQRHIAACASRPCIEGERFAYTYSHLSDEIAKWWSRWSALGVTAGSVIGLRGDYSLAAVSALISLCIRRVIVALIPQDQSAEEYLADACAAGILDFGPDGDHQYRPLRRKPCSHPLLERLTADGETGFVIFTSSSTERPKAAMHSLERFLLSCRAGSRSLRTLAFPLLHEVAGLDTLLSTLWNGGVLVLPCRRDPASILDLIESKRLDVLPTSADFLRRLSCPSNTDACAPVLSKFKLITYGSRPVDGATLRRISCRFPRSQILHKYAAAEVGTLRTAWRGNESHWFTIETSGTKAARVVNGLLWLWSSSAMLGYLNAPSPLDADGWYCTGIRAQGNGEWIRFLSVADELVKDDTEQARHLEAESPDPRARFHA